MSTDQRLSAETIPQAPAWFDIAAQDYIDDPGPVLFEAREEVGGPIMRLGDDGPFMVLTYEAAKAALADPEGFSSAMVKFPEGDLVPDAYRDRVPERGFNHELMVATDPPSHTAIRKVANKGFRRPRLLDLEEQLREEAGELIDEFEAAGEGDILELFCSRFAYQTLAALLGLPPDDVPMLKRIGADQINFFFSDAKGEVVEAEELQAWGHWLDARDYFGAIVTARAQQPGDDIISILAAELGTEGAPTVDHIVTQLSGIVTAGADSTANLMAHGLRLLTEHPDQLAECRADPALWANAVEEIFRRRSTFSTIRRGASREVELAGYGFRPGTFFFVSLAAANFDPEKFPDPHRFDIHRENAADHLGLGRGRHFCLGGPLTRIEARVGLETMFERLGDIRVAETSRSYEQTRSAGGSLVALDVAWS
jgi:cytochrome P450